MSTFLRKVPVFAVLSLALSLALPASAAEGAEAYLQGKLTNLSTLVSSKAADDGKRADNAFDELFDYDGLAKATLKDSWEERTPVQRAEFTDVLKSLVKNAYRRNIKKTLGYDVKFTGEKDGETGKIVSSVAKKKGVRDDDQVSIDYVAHEVGGKWQIFDVVTEGSSLVRNYRSQFRKVIDKHGFDELLKRMKAKRDKGTDAE